MKFWPPEEVMRMVDSEKLVLRPFGIFQLGWNIVRLQWTLASTKKAATIAQMVQPFRAYAQVSHLEDIGDEAIRMHDKLSNMADELSPNEVTALRGWTTKVETLAQERLQGLYLITPTTVIDPKRLLGGIESFLSPEVYALLEPIEAIDLDEALRCLLVGNPTAAELMALRTTENLLGRWYEKESGIPVGKKTWGTLLRWFKNEFPSQKREKAKAEITLLDYLNIRRNRLAHPVEVSELSVAETTLLNVLHLVAGIGGFLYDPLLASQSETDSNGE